MFSSTPKRTDMNDYTPDRSFAPSAPAQGVTTIAHGVKVEGDFSSQGDVVIEGEVHGKIASAGTLTVGAKALIKADITADEAVISGVVEGNVRVKKQAVLHATARITGDLTAERVNMESGAALDGRVQIGVAKVELKMEVKTPVKSGKAE